MRRARGLAAIGLAAMLAGPAGAHHVDPYEAIAQAYDAYQQDFDYGDVRAVLARALREAAHDGRLDPSFAIVYAVYADAARFEGNAQFALHLTDEGLRLALSAGVADEDVRNALQVSRAYALADLGRYDEAVEAVRITALWMGEQFGEEARRELEAAAREWAARDADGGQAPPAVELALRLLGEAEAAINAGDTAAALALSSRALLPVSVGLDSTSLAFVNGWSHTVSGVAYRLEGRLEASLSALLRAADLVVTEQWDRQSPPRPIEEFATEPGGRDLLWSIFSNLAAAATMLGSVDIASIALDAAEAFANSPGRRFVLIVQRAAIMLESDEPAAVEEAFARAEEGARAVGDEASAALAHFYRAMAALYRFDIETSQAVSAVVEAAIAAADHAADDLQQREFILASAVRHVVSLAGAQEAVLPLAHMAFDTFRRRQAAQAGYEAGQEAQRRERRRFLESYVEALYAAGGTQ